MHHQQRNKQIAKRSLSATGKTTFMPIGNSMPICESNYDDNITRLCVKRTSK